MEIAYSQEKRKYSKQKSRIISSQYNKTNYNLQIKNKANIEAREKNDEIINKAINATKSKCKTKRTTKANAKHH